MAVVSLMLVDPIAEADTDAEIGAHQSHQAVDSARAEHLPMPDLVTKKSDLHEHHRQADGDEQLVPGVAQQEERQPAGPEEGPDNPGSEQRSVRLPPQQTRFPNLACQLDKVTLDRLLPRSAPLYRRGARCDRRQQHRTASAVRTVGHLVPPTRRSRRDGRRECPPC
jgi:hypothetical protein